MSHNYHSREAGFVSLFTVVFFMLLVSVITIGFLRIMGVEQRQALDNDLTASALDSAESGIEDAKRAILKYLSLPEGDPLKNKLRTALNSSDCDALFQDPAITSVLGISNQGSITGQENLNQFYTCLSVNLDSPDYISSSSANKSEYIPLRPENGQPYDQIVISWHLVSQTVGTEGEGRPAKYPIGTLLPQFTNASPNPGDLSDWSQSGYPAYMRVGLFGYPNGNFTRADINQRSRAVVLAPNQNDPTPGPTSMSAVDPSHVFDQGKLGVDQVACDPIANLNIGTYACKATIELPNDPTLRGNNNNYYLRLTPLYGSTHFKVELKNSATGNIVKLREVQPIIDVTGRASDVFRRIQARVRLDSFSDLPEFAAESADTICKNMEVADGTYFKPNTCN